MKKTVYANWLAVLLLLVQALSGHAQVQGPYQQIDPTHIYKIMNRATGQFLEVGGGDDRTASEHPVNLWGYWGGANQQWRFTYVTNPSYSTQYGYHYAIVNINSNKCLTHDWYTSSSNPSGIVQRNGGYPNAILDPQGPTTMWDLDLVGNTRIGTIKAVSSRAQAGDYLTYDPNVGIKLSTDNNQVWEIIDTNADLNVYEIVNAWSGSMMQANQFDQGVSQSTGYNVTKYAPSFYHWQFSAYDSDNNLSIINRFSQQVLALDGNSLGSTTNIVNNSGAANQKWVLIDVNDSHVLTVAEATDGRQFKMYNRLNGKILQVSGSGDELFQEGKSIQQWNDNGHPWQRWYIRRVSVSQTGITPTLVSRGYSALDNTHVYKIVHHTTGEVLEISGGGDQTQGGRQVGLWSYWGGANQQWKFAPYNYPGTNATVYSIINRNSNAGINANAAREIRQGGGDEWTLTLVPTAAGLQGTIALSPAPLPRVSVSSETFLSAGRDENGNNPNHRALITADQSQLWDIIDVSTNPGVYKIFNRWASQHMLRANEDGGVVTVFDSNPDARNQWSFEPQGNGYVRVVSRSDQRVLGIDNNSPYNNSNARVDPANNRASEYWLPIDINDSHTLTVAEATDGRPFKLYSSNSGKVLQFSDIDANGNDNAPNSYPRRVNQWNDGGHPWQQWTVQYVGANRPAAPATTLASTSKAMSELMNLYPNPVHDVLTLSLPERATIATVKVTDIRGSVVTAPYQTNGKVDVSGLATGLYLLTASDGQHEYHQRFTKE